MKIADMTMESELKNRTIGKNLKTGYFSFLTIKCVDEKSNKCRHEHA